MIKTSINKNVVNKLSKGGNFNVLNKGFQNFDLSLNELVHLITEKGFAFCNSELIENTHGYCHRKADNFKSGQIIAIDIDNTDTNKNRLDLKNGYWSYEDACIDPLLNRFATFIYTTPSHTDHHNRFRIVLVLKRSISDGEKYHKIIQHITNFFKGDKATTSIAQTFYGSSNAKKVLFGNILSLNDLSKLIKMSNVEQDTTVEDNGLMNDIPELQSIIAYIFKNGNTEYDIWWKTLVILNNYTSLSEKQILLEVEKYVTELGNAQAILKSSHNYTDLNIGSLIHFAKLNGYKGKYSIKNTSRDKSIFWTSYTIDNKEKVDISLTQFDQYLSSVGFKQIMIEKGTQLVRIQDNKIYEVQEPEMISFIYKSIRSHKSLVNTPKLRYLVEENMRNRFDKIYHTTIKGLDLYNNQIQKGLVLDTRDSSKVFYKNGYLDINKDTIELKDYKTLDGLIWSNSILEREYTKPIDNQISVFEKFVKCLSTNRGEEMNKDKYHSFKSAIGYLLNRYKNKAKAVAVVLSDEAISDYGEGGTGKSTFCDALGKIRNLEVEDGRLLKPTSQFMFSNVNLSTELISIDDCDTNFQFDKFYHVITGNVTVEKKNKDKFKIPFERAPKMCMTTNYVFKGAGNSHSRRLFEIEVSNYFGEDHTPENEFGHILFEDWDSVEWGRFDLFMASCIQYYLNEGLVRYNQINIKTKKLIENTSAELAEFLQNTIKLDEPYTYNFIQNEFERTYKINLSPHKTTKVLKYYAKQHLKVNIIDHTFRKEGERVFIITDDSLLTIDKVMKNKKFSNIKSKIYELIGRNKF